MKRLKDSYGTFLPMFLKVMTACLLSVILLSGCYFFPKEEEVLAPPLKEPEKVTYETMEVKKGTIERKISGTGYFVSDNQMNLFFKYSSGRLKALHIKYGDVVKAGDPVAELDTDRIESQIKQQEIMLRMAQIDYENAKNSGESEPDIEKASLKVELENIKLNDLNLEYDKSILISPISGEIIYIDDISEGDFINTYQNIATVADPSKLLLKYSDSNAFEFKFGMKVDVKVNDNIFEGEVVLTPSDAPADASEEMKKSVMISIDGLPDSVKIGDTASITLTLEKRENTIVIPKNVMNSYGSRKFVKILVNGIPEERDIEVGMQSSTEVEVLKGIDVGDLVIIG